MKVQFLQSGGFVGLVKGCEFDTAVIAPELTLELERLVSGSGISSSGEYVSDTGRDLQQYEITIEDENGKVSVMFDDLTIPQPAKPLVGFLKKHARPKPLN